jgi:hypothetical protein
VRTFESFEAFGEHCLPHAEERRDDRRSGQQLIRVDHDLGSILLNRFGRNLQKKLKMLEFKIISYKLFIYRKHLIAPIRNN